MINERVQYTANTGTTVISTANTNLDGTGTLGTVLTASLNGTLIKTVFIKATGNTTRGMVRLFITGGGNTRLLAEVQVPAVTKSAIDNSFSAVLNINYDLKSGYILKASTENAESFALTAEGLDWTY